MNNAKYFIMMLLLIISAAGMVISCTNAAIVDDNLNQSSNSQISNFEECEATGNPIMESYPRQCRAQGETFVEEIDKPIEKPTEGKLSGEYTKEIKTPMGTLFLTYSGNEKATLIGTLQRGTPCVEYELIMIMTKDYPSSNVNVNIIDKNFDPAASCIAMLGEPQEIMEEISPVSERTKYSISFEGELLFEGTIKETEVKK